MTTILHVLQLQAPPHAPPGQTSERSAASSDSMMLCPTLALSVRTASSGNFTVRVMGPPVAL